MIKTYVKNEVFNMNRPPGILSSTGLYHVIFRGINRLNIFEETNDYKKMPSQVKKIK
jgi:hypothetical protein